MLVQQSIEVLTTGRGTVDITQVIDDIARDSGVATGLCNVFIQHTSASLIVCENADSDVRCDLESFMSSLVPDGRLDFLHNAEGPDDMPAHVRSILTLTSLTLPIVSGRLGLGTWQGIYLWEHRTAPHSRMLTVSITG